MFQKLQSMRPHKQVDQSFIKNYLQLTSLTIKLKHQ